METRVDPPEEGLDPVFLALDLIGCVLARGEASSCLTTRLRSRKLMLAQLGRAPDMDLLSGLLGRSGTVLSIGGFEPRI